MIARAPCPSRPLLLLGTKRRAALRDALASCIESWRARWATACDPLEISVPCESEHAGPRSSFTIGLTFASREHGELGLLHADADILPSLLGVLAPAETVGAAHGVAREFLIEMMRSLCTELAKRAQVKDVLIETARGSQPTKPRASHLPVALRVGHGKARVVMWLSARAVELLAPPAIAKRATLPVTRRREAVAPERVKLEAMLGDADVSLRDLVQLAVGDVIVLDQPLSRGGHLGLPYGRVVAQVVLGRSGGQRAVSIATQSDQRSEHP
jgi:hypothetical protein